MPSFEYTARDKKGLMVQGNIDAQAEDNVAKILRSKNLVPIQINKKQQVTSIFDSSFFSHPPSLQEMIVLSGQLYSLTKSGVSIINAIGVIYESCENKQLKMALEDITQKLASGIGFSQALKQHSKLFSPLFISLVEIGESTGHIHEAFWQIKTYLEKELISKRKLKSAIRYPMIVIIAVTIAIIIINVFVVPSFIGFFSAFDASLPLPTRFLIACSTLFIDYGWLLLLVLGVLSTLVYLKMKTPQGKFFFAKMVLRIPWLGSFIERTVFSRFCRCFAMVIKANIPLLTGLGVVSQVVNNPVLNAKLQVMGKSIQHGESLLQAAKASSLFSPLVLQMLAVGENTGELDQIFNSLADHYDMELDYDISRVGEIIEPILIMVIAVMVLILALGVFLPMWDISTVAFK